LIWFVFVSLSRVTRLEEESVAVCRRRRENSPTHTQDANPNLRLVAVVLVHWDQSVVRLEVAETQVVVPVAEQ
jgi:hypothetical protein